MKIKIMFDYSSTGLWDENECNITGADHGIPDTLAAAVEAWNELHDFLLMAVNRGNYTVTKDVEDIMEPAALILRDKIAEACPQHEIRFARYTAKE